MPAGWGKAMGSRLSPTVARAVGKPISASLLSLALLALSASIGLAQEEDPPETATEVEEDVLVDDEVPPQPQEGIEEIFVTGRRREELLQSVPISIRAFNQQELETRSVQRLDEIGRGTANMKFDSTIGSNTSSRIYIRGVGQDNPSSVLDPGVGLYIDGVYLPRAGGGLL